MAAHMHGQDNGRPQTFEYLTGAQVTHRQSAINRNHDHIQPANLGIVIITQPVMQVAQVTDAQPADFKNKYDDFIMSWKKIPTERNCATKLY